MNADKIHFSAFDSNHLPAPDHCSLCKCEPALLLYEVCGDDGASWALNGYCCAGCGANLVKALEARQLVS